MTTYSSWQLQKAYASHCYKYKHISATAEGRRNYFFPHPIAHWNQLDIKCVQGPYSLAALLGRLGSKTPSLCTYTPTEFCGYSNKERQYKTRLETHQFTTAIIKCSKYTYTLVLLSVTGMETTIYWWNENRKNGLADWTFHPLKEIAWCASWSWVESWALQYQFSWTWRKITDPF